MKIRNLLIAVTIIFLTMPVTAEGTHEREGETPRGLRKEVSLIIPAESGSTSDQIIRTVLPFLEESLPFTIQAENRLGFSRSPETRSSWIGGNVTGFHDTHAFILFEVPIVLASAPESPLVSFPDILLSRQESSFIDCPVTPAAMRRERINPRLISHIRFRETELVAALKAAIEVRAPMIAALSVELTEMLRTGRLKGLAALSSSPLRIAGYGTIPSVCYWEKEYSPKPDYFGILLPDTVSPDTLKMLTSIWMEKISESRDLRSFAAGRGLVFNPMVIPVNAGTDTP